MKDCQKYQDVFGQSVTTTRLFTPNTSNSSFPAPKDIDVHQNPNHVVFGQQPDPNQYTLSFW